jgi:phosphoesterase RecJ-like protein
VVFDDETKAEEGIIDDDLDEVSALFRQIDGVVVSLLIRQIGEDKYRVSARSKKGFDCAAFCNHFGGGGHMFAAGCNIAAKTPEEAEQIVVEAAQEYFYEC